MNYIKSRGFTIDLLSLLPTELFYFALPTRNSRYLAALRLNRLLRFFRFREFLSVAETHTPFPNVLRVSTLVINILLLIHWNACIYYILSEIIGFGSDTWVYPAPDPANTNLTQVELNNILVYDDLSTQYIYCFWWSTLTLTTIAEVNPPVTFYEEFYMTFLLLLGVIILAYVIGSTTNMFKNVNMQRMVLQTKCDNVKKFLKDHNVDAAFEKRVNIYLDYLWSLPNLDQQDSVLDILPGILRNQLAMNIHMDTLQRVKIFQDCEPGVLRELVSKLKPKIFSPGDFICRKGDIGREMYFIKSGKLEVVSEDGKTVFVTLSAGAAFGEISILDIPGNKNGNKRTANIRSVGFSDLFQLTKDDLWAVLSEYPVAKQTLLEKGKALLRKDNLLDEELAEKIERKSQPIPMQIDFYLNSIETLNEKLDAMFKNYDLFLSNSKKRLTALEKNTLKLNEID